MLFINKIIRNEEKFYFTTNKIKSLKTLKEICILIQYFLLKDKFANYSKTEHTVGNRRDVFSLRQ